MKDAWTDETDPDLGDLDGFLSDVADELDGAIVARGFSLPVSDVAGGALLGVNADGALLLALTATFVGKAARDAVSELVDAVTARYEAAWDAIRAGTHPAIAVLEGAVGAPGAADFWSTEPGYGVLGSTSMGDVWASPSLRPGAYRGQKY